MKLKAILKNKRNTDLFMGNAKEIVGENKNFDLFKNFIFHLLINNIYYLHV